MGHSHPSISRIEREWMSGQTRRARPIDWKPPSGLIRGGRDRLGRPWCPGIENPTLRPPKRWA
eukprot:scaffold649_cov347-Pavlova_lutheri.AAC.14